MCEPAADADDNDNDGSDSGRTSQVAGGMQVWAGGRRDSAQNDSSA